MCSSISQIYKQPLAKNENICMQKIKIIEIPSEVGCAKRGASLGPAAIKIAANQFNSDFFIENEVVTLPDCNSVLSYKNKRDSCSKAKRIQYVLENCQSTCNAVSEVLQSDYFPVVLSADHSSASGIIAGVKQAYPNEKLGIIWIDAHSDLHSPYTTYSGNMHGMPLGASLALDDQGRVLLNKAPNALPKSVQRQWNHLKELGGSIPKISSENLVLIGVRYFKPEHTAVLNNLNVKLHSVEDVRREGTMSISASVDEYLKECDRIFISFDVDSLDCNEVSKGTGTPESDGLYLKEAKDLLSNFMKNPKVVGLEITEVNPLLDDQGNAMAEAAWQILDSAMLSRGNCQD